MTHEARPRQAGERTVRVESSPTDSHAEALRRPLRAEGPETTYVIGSRIGPHVLRSFEVVGPEVTAEQMLAVMAQGALGPAKYLTELLRAAVRGVEPLPRSAFIAQRRRRRRTSMPAFNFDSDVAFPNAAGGEPATDAAVDH